MLLWAGILSKQLPLRMLLPEKDFGTQFQYMTALDTTYMEVEPGIQFDGIKTLIKNVFGTEIEVDRSWEIYRIVILVLVSIQSNSKFL